MALGQLPFALPLLGSLSTPPLLVDSTEVVLDPIAHRVEETDHLGRKFAPIDGPLWLKI